MEGKTSLGEVREVSEEERIGPENLSKVLSHSGPGGATIWVGNLGVDISDAAKT